MGRPGSRGAPLPRGATHALSSSGGKVLVTGNITFLQVRNSNLGISCGLKIRLSCRAGFYKEMAQCIGHCGRRGLGVIYLGFKRFGVGLANPRKNEKHKNRANLASGPRKSDSTRREAFDRPNESSVAALGASLVTKQAGRVPQHD